MADIPIQALSHRKDFDALPTTQTSMRSLIIWNISKAVEKNPCIDLTFAMRLAHERLERESSDERRIVSQTPEERHLTCALLAWQQLGYQDVDSLCKYIENNRNNQIRTSENSSYDENIGNVNISDVSSKSMSSADQKQVKNITNVETTSFDTYPLMGPVVKLPMDTKIVMRVENTSAPRHNAKKQQKTQNDVTNKIDAACCMDSACMQRLAELDKAVNDLRSRAAKLARREAERVELLERAEAAWKDLELGYQRRLSLAEEKEEDLAKQIQKTIEERNSYKNVCTTLAGALKERGDLAEKEQNRLKYIEKDVCDRACVRLRLSEESAKGDAALAEELCRGTQLDRDLQLKEEQARRKLLNLESEIDSSRYLTLETEHAMRFELSALKEQVTEVSKKILTNEANNSAIKVELDQYRQEKANIIEDLDGCKVKCESRMQAKIDELNQKREQLKLLKEKVIECKCKLPLDVAVEVKRTPSLAALCRCTPEDKILETCSCTSLRSQLLSNLLSDLFGGLQAELGGTGMLMPCSLLLCLDDRHNWDRATTVKSNLRNYFSQLLVGELDIAVATSIEKYHAKWVGASCADQARIIPDPGENDNEGWQERAIEHRAQKLATKLAEQLFEDRVEELTRKGKAIVSAGPPPCECKGQQPAVFPCVVKTPMTSNTRKASDVPTSYIKRTLQDVSLLKTQIQELKKDSIKKEDLRLMEDKIARIIQRASAVNNSATSSRNANSNKENNEMNEKIKRGEDSSKTNGTVISVKRKEFENMNLNKYIKKSPNSPCGRIEKNTNKMFKKLEQSFAVNLCLCNGQDASSKLNPILHRKDNLKHSWKQKKSKDLLAHISNVKQIKPVHTIAAKENNHLEKSKFSAKTFCPNNCTCFHKIPSNTSIDKLLEKLTKWNGSLDKVIEDTVFFNRTKEDGNKTKNLSIKSEIIDFEKIINPNDALSRLRNFTTISSQLHDEVNNKSTICDNRVPFSTESEYMGTVNLDKSNYNVCKCPINNNENVTHGDGKSGSVISFHCINTDVCECKSEMGFDVRPQERHLHTAPSIEKMSNVYSVNIPHSQLKCIKTDTDFLNNNVSEKSVIISGDTFIHDVVKKSQLFPHDCDYLVKFLGVTITNANSPNKLMQVNNHKKKQISSAVLNKQDNYVNEIILDMNLKDNDIPTFVSLENSSHNIGLKKIKCEVLDKKEDGCICCSHQELSKDLEVNTFNLLEEHIKRKLSEFQHFSDKSFCIPPEDEKKLFGTILDKVKEVISENIKPFSCKCCNKNTKDGSWNRAYGLLQEYLKVKIKRIQCTHLSSEGNVDSILPSILEKVCDLIENDFQRLKEKCKCVNKNSDQILLEPQKSIIVPNQLRDKKFNKSFVRDDKATEQPTKIEDFFLPHTGVNDKSCEVLNDLLKDLSTSEKKISCEFRVYGTGCHCNTFTESYRDKSLILNQFSELLSMKDNQIKNSISLGKVSNTKNISCAKEDFMSLKEDCKSLHEYDVEDKQENFTEIQHIGCMLSCKSLEQTVTDKVDHVCKSLAYETCPKKCSDIDKVFTNLTCGIDLNTNDTTNSHLNNKLSINNVEVNTFDNKEDIVLKYSNENFCITSYNTKTFDESSVGTKDTNNEYLTDCHEFLAQQQNDKYQPDTMFGKNFLYDSLNLPSAVEDLDKAHGSRNLFSTKDGFEESEKCVCNMVPICHVKMLVENIEKKLVHLQCTCDSLRSQACPVHSKREIFYN